MSKRIVNYRQSQANFRPGQANIVPIGDYVAVGDDSGAVDASGASSPQTLFANCMKGGALSVAQCRDVAGLPQPGPSTQTLLLVGGAILGAVLIFRHK